MILDRRERVKIRDARFVSKLVIEQRGYIYRDFPANTFSRAYVEDRQTLGSSMIREIVSCHHGGWTTSCFYANDVFSLLTAFVRCVISVFT